MFTHNCPSCSHRLLRHINHRGLYWRCTHCREDFAASYPAMGAEVKRNSVVSLSEMASLERIAVA